jgi:sucrose-phosphate synthase
MTSRHDNLYILQISIHGLIRGRDLELGRDADTGGQIKYVVELARALGERPEVGRVDLLTRRVDDPRVDDGYARPEESLSDRARIVRLDCGGGEYLPKEALWDHLDEFVDRTFDHIRAQDRLPDIIHSHYADAGHVGARLSHQLGVPLAHTGHSLGRVKRRRLLADGLGREEIETRYNIARRIEAEEETLSAAELVVTSTRQEIEEQYWLYDHYTPEQMRVIPPGTDLSRFRPPAGDEWGSEVASGLRRFLTAPRKPIILALSRPDRRKNIITLIEAYGDSPELQAAANLVVVAGNREDIRDLDAAGREVLTNILLAIDRTDLYGRVAYPKQHAPDDVPLYYRLAALSGGVFVNPALTEPFGLTLIEAAASGLPVVATEDGGPVDITENCRNGLLVDPLDREAIAAALLDLTSDRDRWREMAENGLEGVRRHYAWPAHAAKYLDELAPVLERAEPLPRRTVARSARPYRDRAIFTDLDQNLLGDRTSLAELLRVVQANRKRAAWGIATGRRLDSALRIMRQYGIPRPDVLITSLGTEIHYAPGLTRDRVWSRHVDHLWHRWELTRILEDLPGLERQAKSEQSVFKLSYYIDPDVAPSVQEIRRLLHTHELSVNVVHSFGQYLDIVPVRASKGFALRWYCDQREVPVEQVLAAGGSGADEDMMRGNTLAVVVANRHHEELSDLTEAERIFFATRPFAGGILEALEHYDFFGACRAPVG